MQNPVVSLLEVLLTIFIAESSLYILMVLAVQSMHQGLRKLRCGLEIWGDCAPLAVPS